MENKDKEFCEKENCCMNYSFYTESNCCKKSPSRYGAMVFLGIVLGMILVSSIFLMLI